MDPISLIASAAVPYLVNGADAFAKTAGKILAEKVLDLCQTIENKIKDDTYAAKTLALAKEKPQSGARQTALQGVLASKMEDDPDLAEKVRQLVDEVQKESRASNVTFDQHGQIVMGDQQNIENVQGDVNIGSRK